MIKKIRTTILTISLTACAMLSVASFPRCCAEEISRDAVTTGLKDARDGKRIQAVRLAVKGGFADAEMIAALAAALKDSSADVRRTAAFAIEKLSAPATVAAAGAEAKPAAEKAPESHARDALQAIIEAAADKDLSARAAIISALGTLGSGEQKVLPILLNALKDASPQMRVTAIEALRRYGAALDAISPALVEAALNEKHPDAMNALAVTLADCKPMPPELVPFYVNALKGSAPLRAKAIEALNKIGAKVVPALLPLLKNDLVVVRREAAAIIEKFSKENPEAIPQWVVALTDTDAAVRKSAVAALTNIGPAVQSALPDLIKLLTHTDVMVRASAAGVIEALGAPAKEAVPELVNLIQEKTLACRTAAGKALAKMGEPGRTELLKLLKSPRDEVRSAASLALVLCGNDAMSGLAEILKSDSPEAVAAALLTLDRMGGAQAEAIAACIPLLRSKQAAIRTQAANVLAKCGVDAVQPLIGALICSPEAAPEVRSGLTDALGRCGRGAIAPLVAIINDKRDGPMLCSAIEALGKIGAPASEATPLLISRLATAPTPPAVPAATVAPAKKVVTPVQTPVAAPAPPPVPAYVKLDVAILQALSGFGARADSALPTLFELLKDGDYLVRSEAGKAIAKIAHGTERIPPLGEILERCDAGPVANALRVFQSAGMNALIAELDTPSPLIRQKISAVFSNLAPVSTYPFLSIALKNEEPRIRSGVAQIIADFRRISKKSATASATINATLIDPLLLALKDAVKDSDPDVRVLAAYSYQKAIDPDDAEIIEKVASGLAQCAVENRPRGMIALDFYNLEKAPRKAAPALPVLIRSIGSETAGTPTAKAMIQRIGITKDDLPALVGAIKEKTPLIRRYALHAIETLGPEARDAVGPLIDSLADEEKGAKAVEPALVAIGQDALPLLIDSLKSPNIKTRLGVIQILSQINLDAEWLGKIAALLSDDRPELRASALSVLSTSVDRAKYALPHVRDLLIDADKLSTRARQEFFSVLGAEATPVLIDALKDTNPLLRSRAAIALKPRGTVEPPAEALKPLMALLSDDNLDVKAAALQTLSAYSANAAEIVPGLVDAMKDDSVILRRAALLYLKQHGSAAPAAAISALTLALKDPTPKIRLMAIEATKDLGAAAGPLLFEAIGDAEHNVRAQAAAALEAAGLANDPDKKILIGEMFALDAIEQYAQAQEDHFIKSWDDNRVHYYAATLTDLTALPKTLAAADNTQVTPAPYNGFLFKMLEGQGANAPGGAKKYAVDGKMTQGHALVAFPAECGKTGRFTFIVGDDGTIYKKDLGAETLKLCVEMKELNPDETWTKFKVKPKDEGPVRFHTLDPEGADDMEF